LGENAIARSRIVFGVFVSLEVYVWSFVWVLAGTFIRSSSVLFVACLESHWSAILVGGDVSGRLAPFGFSEFFTGSRCVVVPLERVDRERECVC